MKKNNITPNESEKYNVIKSIYKPKNPAMTKRLGAFILDFICVLIIAIGFTYLLSIIIKYDATQNALDAKYLEHGIKILNEDGKLVFIDQNSPNFATLWAEFNNDSEACTLFDTMVEKTLILPLFGFSISILIFELIVPLILKNGRTIGMWVFNIALITKEEIKVKFKNVFIRFLFGKWLVNGMLPILCVLMFYFGFANIFIVVILLAIIFANIFLLINNPHHITIPDYFGNVFPCDNESQLYFDTVDELNAAKCKEVGNINNKSKKYY